MNKLFGVLIGILVCTSVAAEENDFRCLTFEKKMKSYLNSKKT